MRKPARYFYAITSMAAIVMGYSFGEAVTYNTQSGLLDALRDTSSIIMAVLGIWIAVIYPNLLPKLLNDESVTFEKPQLERVRSLILPMVTAAIVICVTLALPSLVLVIKQVPSLMQHVPIMRRFSFALLCFLSWTQIYAVLQALIPAVLALNKAEQSLQQSELIKERNE